MPIPRHTEMLEACKERMDSIETIVNNDLSHINDKLTQLENFLSVRMADLTDRLARVQKKVEGDGTIGIPQLESRMHALEVKVEENTKQIITLTTAIGDEQKTEFRQYKNMFIAAIINLVVMLIGAAAVLITLYEKGILNE